MPPKIRHLVIRDMTVISQRALSCPPGILPEELVRNGEEAGGDVDLYSDRDGSILVVDNGHGMSEQDLASYLGEFGAGNKRRGGTGNLGVGAKSFVLTHSPEGIEWISKVAGSPRAFRLELTTQGIAEVGAIEDDKGKIVFPCDIPRHLRGKNSGTVVKIRGMQFDAAALAKHLNGHILTPKRTIQVWQPWGDKTKPIAIVGLIKCMEEIAMTDTIGKKFGVVNLPNADVYWAIKKPADELEGSHFAKYAFDINGSVFKAWNGRVYRSWPTQHGGPKMLARWGITAGASRVMILAIAKDLPNVSKKQQIVPNDIRSDFENWDEIDAQEQFIAQMPEELELWMEAFKKDHWEDQPEKELVQELLNLTLGRHGSVPGKAGIRPGIPKSEPRRPPGKSSGGGDRASGGGGGSGRTRPYDYVFVDESELGNLPLRLDGNVIKINVDHSLLRDQLKQAGDNLTEQKALRGLIAMEILTAITTYSQFYKKDPSDDGLLLVASGLGATRLRAFDRTILPLGKISVADGRREKRLKRKK